MLKTKSIDIDPGFLFEYVTCANYTFEILGWLLFNVAAFSLMGVVFLLCGAVQMSLWAIQKHKRLLKLFDGKENRTKYPRRFIILPPIL